jgi:hypothetical protein
MTRLDPTRRLFLAGLTGLGAFTSGCSKIWMGDKKDDPKTDPGKPTPAPSLTAGEKTFLYAIEVQRPGGPQLVKEDYSFRSGDGFRLRLKPGFNAYVYVLNRGNREKGFKLLFPSLLVRARNPIASGGEAVIPDDPQKWMRMDEVAGEENFILVASMSPLPDLEDPQRTSANEVDQTLTSIEREYRPQSSRRFEDGDWVKVLAADGGKDIAMVLRIPLRHT